MGERLGGDRGAGIAQQLPEDLCQCGVVGCRAGGQDAKVGSVGAGHIGVGFEALVEPFEHGSGEERGAVYVIGKGAGLAEQVADQVAPLDRVLVAVDARSGTDKSAAVKQFHAFQPHPAAELFADV